MCSLIAKCSDHRPFAVLFGRPSGFPSRFTHRGYLLAFICLSLLDLLLTAYLLNASQGTIYEANPIAAWILGSYGWAALSMYKLVLVALIATIIAYVGSQRPPVARRLVKFACVLMLTVIGYSTCLISC